MYLKLTAFATIGPCTTVKLRNDRFFLELGRQRPDPKLDPRVQQNFKKPTADHSLRLSVLFNLALVVLKRRYLNYAIVNR